MPTTRYPFPRRSSARYEPSCPVTPVMRATRGSRSTLCIEPVADVIPTVHDVAAYHGRPAMQERTVKERDEIGRPAWNQCDERCAHAQSRRGRARLDEA